MASKTKKSVPNFAGLDLLFKGAVNAEQKAVDEHLAELAQMKSQLEADLKSDGNAKTRDGGTMEQLNERIGWHGKRAERLSALCKEARAELDAALKEAKAVRAEDVVAVAKAWRIVQLAKCEKIFGNTARRLFTEAVNSVVAA